MAGVKQLSVLKEDGGEEATSSSSADPPHEVVAPLSLVQGLLTTHTHLKRVVVDDILYTLYVNVLLCIYTYDLFSPSSYMHAVFWTPVNFYIVVYWECFLHNAQWQKVSGGVASSVGGGGGGEKGKGGEMEGRRMSLSRQHAKDISDYTRQLLVKDRELESLRVRLCKVSKP